MGVLLVIATFALFILVDYLLSRRASEREAREAEALLEAGAGRHAAVPVPMSGGEAVWVGGYELRPDRHYHPGHLWARVLAPDTVAVGIDDFARRLLGRATAVVLPPVGSTLVQGGAGARIEVEGREADVVSPVAGEVSAVNPALRTAPELATQDPYGRGWLYKIRSSNLAAAPRNLLSGSLSRKWLEHSREELDLRLMVLSGSVLQDGGDPAHDFGSHLDTDAWKELVEKFLLTSGAEHSGA